MGAERVCGSKARCAGIRPAAGAHGWNINESKVFLAWPSGRVPVPVRRPPVPSGAAGVGNVSGARVWGVVFGALLGPEATGPFAAMQTGAFCFWFPGSADACT